MSNLPTSLGKYQIIREIARSNDIVYEAYDPVMNRRVAVKELALLAGSSSSQREDRLRRFLREAKAAGSLSHPNIVTIYEVGEEAGRTYLAMEFLDGHTLRNEIDTNGFLSPDRAVEVATAILEALDYAHQHGVIHRDIKPDNIQLLSDGRIKLTDFGIARLTFEPNLTIDGQIFGTPSYMLPEQVVGKEIDARSDLFSVGTVMYEMLSGRKPFQGDSVVSITYSIMNAHPEQIQNLSWPLWQFLERALDKTPAMRFGSAHEMAEALKQAVEASRQTVISPTPTYAPLPPAPPATYPYNPYQPTTAHAPPPVVTPVQLVAGPGGHPVLSVGGVQVPVYYPPPPRQPLLKPETRVFLSRLFVTFVVLGTLFGLVIVGVNSMSRVIERMNLQQQDSEIRDRLLKGTSGGSLQDRIAQYEALIAKMRSPEMQAAEKRNLAVLYEQMGQQSLGNGDRIVAESCFTKAIDLDPDNAAYASDLAALYATAANNSQGTQRVEMLQASANQWERAVQTEPNSQRRQTYASGAASTLYNYASAISLTDPYEARQKLYKAREYAEPSSALALDIQALLKRLTER